MELPQILLIAFLYMVFLMLDSCLLAFVNAFSFVAGKCVIR
jgi:hypothetical protein